MVPVPGEALRGRGLVDLVLRAATVDVEDAVRAQRHDGGLKLAETRWMFWLFWLFWLLFAWIFDVICWI